MRLIIATLLLTASTAFADSGVSYVGVSRNATSAPACNDGIDNDGDIAGPGGGIDYPDDLGCWGPDDDDEGWPTALTTGPYSTGTNLRGQCIELCTVGGMPSSGSINTSSSGTTIQCLTMNGGTVLTIDEDNTTIRCIDASTNTSKIKITASGTVIEDVAIDRSGIDPPSEIEGNIWIQSGADNTVIERVELTGWDDGIKADAGNGLLIRDSFIHNPYGVQQCEGQPHNDGIELDGGTSNIVVEGNWIAVDENNADCKTAAFMHDNWQGTQNNTNLRRNYLDGDNHSGAYTIYCDGSFNSNAMSNLTYIHNMVLPTTNGYFHGEVGQCNLLQSGNIDANTGNSIMGSDSLVQCNDGIDNDDDGLIDWGLSDWNENSGTGCTNGRDNTE